jgi:hypothetical protein
LDAVEKTFAQLARHPRIGKSRKVRQRIVSETLRRRLGVNRAHFP